MIDRGVILRAGTEDRQVWSDTFTGRYHIPPGNVKPSNVLDLGCNIGLTLAHYRSMWPEAKIVGVEMDHECACLAELNAPGSIVLERAVAGAPGLSTYDPGVRTDSFALGSPGREVRVYTLGETISDAFGDARVDFVKMDIEGAEWEVFKDGSWAPRVEMVLVELHDSGTSPEIVQRGIDALSELGFQARHHRRHPQAVWAWK